MNNGDNGIKKHDRVLIIEGSFDSFGCDGSLAIKEDAEDEKRYT